MITGHFYGCKFKKMCSNLKSRFLGVEEMKRRGNIYKYALIGLTAVLITVAAFATGCEVYRVLPLYVSLIVMYLQTKASRFSFLLGGCNAAYYAFVYVITELYGMALYSILLACPIQIVTYIRWKRHTFANTTRLDRLTATQRIVSILAFAGVWTGLYFLLGAFGSEYLILDNSVTLLSAAANVTSLLCLIEFPYLQCVSYVVNIALYTQMIQKDPRQWTFLIYAIYALICCAVSAVYMQKQYNWQKKEMQNN